jgi:hypothetical protein|tara:strand:+ start:1104 stop:1358 length:255 start_codon:yes stop_codon:yes gene_type:complete
LSTLEARLANFFWLEATLQVFGFGTVPPMASVVNNNPQRVLMIDSQKKKHPKPKKKQTHKKTSVKTIIVGSAFCSLFSSHHRVL